MEMERVFVVSDPGLIEGSSQVLFQYGAIGAMLVILVVGGIWMIRLHRAERKEWNAEASKKFETIVELTKESTSAFVNNTKVVENVQATMLRIESKLE